MRRTRASACSARSTSSTTSPIQSARSLRSATLLRDRAGLRQPESVLRDQRAERRAGGVPRNQGFGLQIHPCDSSCRISPTNCASWCAARASPDWCCAPPMSERMELIRYLAAQRHQVRAHHLAPRKIPNDGYPCVYVDDRDAAYEITEHLIQLGHQRIGFLWGGARTVRARNASRATKTRSRTTASRSTRSSCMPGDYSFDDGFRGARRLFALRDRPTAIFGSNDEIAAGVLAAAKSGGIDVPYELSIAGFEDSPFSKQSWPALTTAKQATEDIARHAALRADRRAEARMRTRRPWSAQSRLRAATGDPRFDRARAARGDAHRRIDEEECTEPTPTRGLAPEATLMYREIAESPTCDRATARARTRRVARAGRRAAPRSAAVRSRPARAAAPTTRRRSRNICSKRGSAS